jgi:outer membrane protein TolC
LADLLEARAAELRARMGAAAAAADRVVAEANLRLALGLPPEGDEG